MKLNVIIGANRNNTQAIEVAESVFAVSYNAGLIHQVTTAYMAGGRAGTRAQKSRAQVSGGGVKPWKQKGTGRARAGSIRSPLWRKGGTTFAARPQDHSQKVNRKMYQGALRSIFAELIREQRLHVIDAITVQDNKTKSMLAFLTALGFNDALIVTHDPAVHHVLASRNLPFVDVIDVSQLDPVSLIGFAHVVITQEALKQIEESLL